MHLDIAAVAGAGDEVVQPVDGAEHGALARSRRPDDGGDRLGRDGEVKIVDHRPLAVGKRELVQDDGRRPGAGTGVGADGALAGAERRGEADAGHPNRPVM